ncbi:hypothetical protein AC249_AIPGENE9809 [Exaiptasia diaphana]|nr:hypothetical protein AC249_AIPGENE9809 [Exaiptasia diaphana]
MAGDEEGFCYQLERALSDLKEKGFNISLKEEQRQALEQLFSLGLKGCNLVDAIDNLDMLSSVDVIYASAESALDRRFTDFFIDKDNKSFVSRILWLWLLMV